LRSVASDDLISLSGLLMSAIMHHGPSSIVFQSSQLLVLGACLSLLVSIQHKSPDRDRYNCQLTIPIRYLFFFFNDHFFLFSSCVCVCAGLFYMGPGVGCPIGAGAMMLTIGQLGHRPGTPQQNTCVVTTAVVLPSLLHPAAMAAASRCNKFIIS
jgi:hypothetical protein